jgi:hypothetical protein
LSTDEHIVGSQGNCWLQNLPLFVWIRENTLRYYPLLACSIVEVFEIFIVPWHHQ